MPEWREARGVDSLRVTLTAMALSLMLSTVPDEEVARELEWEAAERAFVPHAAATLGLFTELQFMRDDLAAAMAARAGVRLYLGSFWSTSFLAQLTYSFMPGGSAYTAALPIRIELDHFKPGREHLFPDSAVYAIAAPSLTFRRGEAPGPGFRLGVGAQAMFSWTTAPPVFTEISYEHQYFAGRVISGARVSIGFGL